MRHRTRNSPPVKHIRSLYTRETCVLETYRICIHISQFLMFYPNIMISPAPLNATRSVFLFSSQFLIPCPDIIGWLRLVGSFKLQVSFAEYRLLYRALLQKRPMILRSLLIVATPYDQCYTTTQNMSHICIYIYMYTHTYIYIYVCVCTCIYIYIYIYI